MAFISIPPSMQLCNTDKIMAIRENKICFDSETNPVFTYEEPNEEIDKIKKSFAEFNSCDSKAKDWYNDRPVFINPKYVESAYEGGPFDYHVYVKLSKPCEFDEMPSWGDPQYKGIMLFDDYSIWDVMGKLNETLERNVPPSPEMPSPEPGTPKRRLPNVAFNSTEEQPEADDLEN